jgi:ribonuclease P protein subunit POP4
VIPKQNSIFTFAVPLYSTLPPTFKFGMPYPVPSGLNVAPLRPESETPGAKDAEASTTSPSSGPGVPSSSTSSIFIPNSDQIVLDVPHLVFELYGNQFRFRSSERAGRKFKHKETIEL